MCRRRQQLPEPIRQALADQADEHGLPVWAVLAGAFGRIVADWSSHRQIQFTVPPDGSVTVDMDQRRSFLDCARDIVGQLDPAGMPALFSLSSWLLHKIHRSGAGGDFELTWDSAVVKSRRRHPQHQTPHRLRHPRPRLRRHPPQIPRHQTPALPRPRTIHRDPSIPSHPQRQNRPHRPYLA